MVVTRLVVAASFAFAIVAGPASATDSASPFGAISATLKSALADTGAPGDALLIGKKDTIFYVETAGKASLTTAINLPAKTDIAQLMLMLALIDSGFLDLDDPVKNYLTLYKFEPTLTIGQLMAQRASGGKEAAQASQALILVAESAAARPWEALFKQWIATPAGLENTQYQKAPGLASALGAKAPTGVVETNGRDYARLLLALTNGGTVRSKEILSPKMNDLVFRSQMIGGPSCLRQDETAMCNLIEQDAVGLYAWVDRSRGLYGVFTAPGAEVSIAKAGREIRAEAETIFDREQAGAGLTSATGTGADHSIGK